MNILQTLYVVSAVLFILGIWALSSPETARRGMNLAAIGMFIAIVGTLFNHHIITYKWIIAGIVVGTLISIPITLWIPMTAIPQRIAISHAGGALAACLIGIAEYYRYSAVLGHASMGVIAVEVMLGALTFTGSLMVAGKLQGILPGRPITYKGQNAANISLFIVLLGIVGYLILYPQINTLFYIMLGLAFLVGVFLVVPIGAADMPVVIALFNSYGGLTGAVMGFMLSNRIQIITGALDGASGFILSMLMCKAMNRSMSNVLFGAFGQQVKTDTASVPHAVTTSQPTKATTVGEVAKFFADAKLAIIVPGYGMGASQAHFALRDFADKLKARGITVKYAIHPVAGRMPGHMNVLLAEANVPYTELFDMENINPEFQQADIVLVVGANDVTNPAARENKASPIYGMPILDVDKAKKIVVCKRSMSPGFSGIENELYFRDHTWLLFGDAKESLMKLAEEFKK